MLLAFGAALLLICAAGRIYSVVSSHIELHRSRRTYPAQSDSRSARDPDFDLWSQQRIAAYRTSLRRQSPLRLEVAVLQGTDDLTLNRAVGHIEGTAALGSLGNIGIAGHRDEFFRGFKDIRRGDVIELISQNRTDRYLVDEILIVSPEETSVLSYRPQPSLTLVTCYLFSSSGALRCASSFMRRRQLHETPIMVESRCTRRATTEFSD